MNKILACTGFVLYALAVLSCAGSVAAKSSAGFDMVLGRDWILEEFTSASVTTRIDRTKSGGIEIYSLRFETQRLGGSGAPNRYSASYTTGEDKTISIGMVSSTRMAPIFENENLREYDYFGCLQKVYRWDLRNGKLELYTKSETGNEAVLIFF